MTKNAVLLFLIFTTFACFSQETMTVQGKNWAASPKWNFICENYALSGSADVRIAKTLTGGALEISIPTTSKEYYIGGTAYVYLIDNSFITCTDKGFRQNDGKKLTSFYLFSAAEYAKIKKLDIQSLRFNIKGPRKRFENQVGNFTAENKVNFYGTFGRVENNRFPTAEVLKTTLP